MSLHPHMVVEAAAKGDWIDYRLNFKGKTTSEKIELLYDWLDDPTTDSSHEMKEVQVLWYLNGLTRGGLIEKVHECRGEPLKRMLRQRLITVYREQ